MFAWAVLKLVEQPSDFVACLTLVCAVRNAVGDVMRILDCEASCHQGYPKASLGTFAWSWNCGIIKDAMMGSDSCVATTPERRKCHNDEAGYVAQRNHPLVPDTHIVIYLAEQQGIPAVGGGRFLIVDEAHNSSCIQTSDRETAYELMRHPDNFCDGCRQFAAL